MIERKEYKEYVVPRITRLNSLAHELSATLSTIGTYNNFSHADRRRAGALLEGIRQEMNAHISALICDGLLRKEEM